MDAAITDMWACQVWVHLDYIIPHEPEGPCGIRVVVQGQLDMFTEYMISPPTGLTITI